jgi:DNA-3-methyladenine glycosylase II
MTLSMNPVPPFDFDLSASIFSGGDEQIRKHRHGKYWQVLRVGGKLILAIVSSSGSLENPKLSVRLESGAELSHADKKAVKSVLGSILNLDLDLTEFYSDVSHDHVIAGLTRKLRGLKSPVTPSVFEALISSIVEQQISLDVANRIEGRMVKTFGDSVNLEGRTYYAFPMPERLSSVSVGQLRGCGLSSRKSEYISEISKLIVDGKLDLDDLAKITDTRELLERLCTIRGVGTWTAELTMLRGMRRFEVIPADDLGVRRSVSHYYCENHKITAERVRRIAEAWGRWKGLAGYYLIVAEKLGVEP